jgi:hypothetical protein
VDRVDREGEAEADEEVDVDMLKTGGSSPPSLVTGEKKTLDSNEEGIS